MFRLYLKEYQKSTTVHGFTGECNYISFPNRSNGFAVWGESDQEDGVVVYGESVKGAGVAGSASDGESDVSLRTGIGVYGSGELGNTISLMGNNASAPAIVGSSVNSAHTALNSDPLGFGINGYGEWTGVYSEDP